MAAVLTFARSGDRVLAKITRPEYIKTHTFPQKHTQIHTNTRLYPQPCGEL